MNNNAQQIKALTTYAQYMYETNRGKKKVMVNVDDMEVVSLEDVGIISTNFLPRLPIRSTTTNEWRWLDENHFQIRR